MQQVQLYLIRDDFRAAALALSEAGVFAPKETTAGEIAFKEDSRQRFERVRARFEKIQNHFGITREALSEQFVTNCTCGEPPTPPAMKAEKRDFHGNCTCGKPPTPPTMKAEKRDFHGNSRRVVTEQELIVLDTALERLWQECAAAEEQQKHLDEEQHHIDTLQMALNHFEGLNINFALLQSGTQFLDVRIGAVPVDHVERLREALALSGFILVVFNQDGETQKCVIAGLKSNHDDETGALLASAGWRRLTLPEAFVDHPQRVRREISKRRKTVLTKHEALQKALMDRHADHTDLLKRAAKILTLTKPLASLSSYCRGGKEFILLSGWAPRDQVDVLKKRIADRLAHPFICHVRDPLPEEHGEVPSMVRHAAWLAPFLALVKNYGMPRYGEFDPTALFAVTFTAMFGMMFGDVGHGALIALSSRFLPDTLRSAKPFVVAIGISSIFFGALYGSIFGFEEIFHPLWISPLSDPLRMLTMALYWGIGFVLLASTLSMINRFSEGRLLEAFLDSRGMTGILLYGGLLYGGYRWITQGFFSWTESAAILAPLCVILGYKWREATCPPGERLLVVFVEGFEAMMGYIANTLSFLRVAAFSLNHVALAVAVLALANMMETTGHWITILIGNLFILILEGAIVAIQALRLEYYEGFSRFFSGDGHLFRPIRLNASRS